jgi:hypothetical protein
LSPSWRLAMVIIAWKAKYVSNQCSNAHDVPELRTCDIVFHDSGSHCPAHRLGLWQNKGAADSDIFSIRCL